MTPDPSRPLDVLVVTPKGFLGGAERWLLTMVDHTDRMRVRVIQLDEGPLSDQLRTRGIPVEVVKVGPSGLDVAKAAAKLGANIRRNRPDVILANGIKAAMVVTPASVATGIPYVWAKLDPTFEDSLGRIAAKTSARVIASSAAEAVATGRTDTVVISSPVSFPSMAERPSADPSAPLRLLMLTRLMDNKGVDVAIEALVDAPEWELLVAGADDPSQPDERSRLLKLAASLGVADRVDLIGEVSSGWELMAQVQAAAVLSRPGSPRQPAREGFGTVAFEGAGFGVPVLADPRYVPSVDLLGGAGIVPVDAANPAEVAAALALLRSAEVRTTMGEAGAAAARLVPGPAEAANSVVDVLAGVAARPGAGINAGPAFTIALTVFNEGDVIDTLVKDLRAQIRVGRRPAAAGDETVIGVPRSADDEIVIVDGGSTDGTWERLLEIAAADPAIRVFSEPGAGISEGRNHAIERAHCEWIACTDGGCRPYDGWLEAFRQAAAIGDYDLLTGLYSVASPQAKTWQKALAFTGYPDVAEAQHMNLPTRVYTSVLGLNFRADLPTGRSVAFTKAAWRSVGGYPTHLATAEDVLFGYWIVENGGRAVLVADAIVDWDQRPTLKAASKMFRGYGRGGGQSGAKLLIARDLIRAGAYLAGPIMVARGGKGRALALAGAATYWSLPIGRVIRHRQGIRVAAMVPVVAAVRDVSKAVGCIEGLTQKREPEE